jgi:hypothetical protein
MNIKILFFLSVSIIAMSAKAQDWKPGYYYDTTGVKHTGLIEISTMDNAARYNNIKTIASDVFRIKVNSNIQEVYAFDVKAVVADADSFVVQHSFRTNRRGVIKKDTNGTPYRFAAFFQAELDRSDIKLYSQEKAGNSMYFNHVSMLGPNFVDYYYGKSVDNIVWITNENFIEVMSNIMKDSPGIVAKIQKGDFKLRKMDKLLKAYKIEKGIPISKEYNDSDN